MNSAGVAVSDSPTPANLFDEFEEAFQNCLAPLTKEDPLNGINQEELKVNADTNGQRFLELAHRMDAAFLQKRFLLSVQKPELLLMEENHEMRIEISRKDELIKKQTEKLAEWQNTLVNLVNIINRVGSVPPHGGARTPTVGGPPQGTMPPGHMSMMGGVAPPGQSPMNVVTPSGSVTIVGGGMSHGPNIPHSMASSITMNTIGHQPMMGQVSPGSTSMGAMSQGSGGYSPMGNMGASVTPMHSGGVGGASPSSMGPMGNQGPTVNSSGGTGGGPATGGPGGGGMFHGSGTSPMGGMSQQSQGGLQGPLAYLEKTTTNIGMPESRR